MLDIRELCRSGSSKHYLGSRGVTICTHYVTPQLPKRLLSLAPQVSRVISAWGAMRSLKCTCVAIPEHIFKQSGNEALLYGEFLIRQEWNTLVCVCVCACVCACACVCVHVCMYNCNLCQQIRIFGNHRQDKRQVVYSQRYVGALNICHISPKSHKKAITP